jgi:hypothetical protein
MEGCNSRELEDSNYIGRRCHAPGDMQRSRSEEEGPPVVGLGNAGQLLEVPNFADGRAPEAEEALVEQVRSAGWPVLKRHSVTSHRREMLVPEPPEGVFIRSNADVFLLVLFRGLARELDLRQYAPPRLP